MRVTINGKEHVAKLTDSKNEGTTALDTYSVDGVGTFRGYRDRMRQWSQEGFSISSIEETGDVVKLAEGEASPTQYGDGDAGAMHAIFDLLHQ